MNNTHHRKYGLDPENVSDILAHFQMNDLTERPIQFSPILGMIIPCFYEPSIERVRRVIHASSAALTTDRPTVLASTITYREMLEMPLTQPRDSWTILRDRIRHLIHLHFFNITSELLHHPNDRSLVQNVDGLRPYLTMAAEPWVGDGPFLAPTLFDELSLPELFEMYMGTVLGDDLDAVLG